MPFKTGSSSGGASKKASGAAVAAVTGLTGAAISPGDNTTPSIPQSALPIPDDCPADVTALGRATWTFLHSMAAQYPEKASSVEQIEMKSFLGIFSKVYPCWHCAEDFRTWISTKGNEPRVGGRDELGDWLCVAHNEVNQKLGKDTFDCSLWKYRWKDGWPDGRCD